MITPETLNRSGTIDLGRLPNHSFLPENSIFMNPAEAIQAGYYPVNPDTGIPFPVIVLRSGPKPPPGEEQIQEKNNSHHVMYERTNPFLEGSLPELRGLNSPLMAPEKLSLEQLAGLAVRVSRVQRMEISRHNRLHAECPKGTYIPTDIHNQFRLATLMVGGVISKFGFDPYATKGSHLKLLRADEVERYANPFWMDMERYNYGRPDGYQEKVVGMFLAKYLARYGAIDVPKAVVNNFVHMQNTKIKTQLAKRILLAANFSMTEDLTRQYSHLRAVGMVLPKIGSEEELSMQVERRIKPFARAAIEDLQERLAA